MVGGHEAAHRGLAGFLRVGGVLGDGAFVHRPCPWLFFGELFLNPATVRVFVGQVGAERDLGVSTGLVGTSALMRRQIRPVSYGFFLLPRILLRRLLPLLKPLVERATDIIRFLLGFGLVHLLINIHPVNV